MSRLLRGYAETGEYALIISLGYSQGSSVEAVAPNYPDQKFMLIDAEVDCENVACYSWRENRTELYGRRHGRNDDQE